MKKTILLSSAPNPRWHAPNQLLTVLACMLATGSLLAANRTWINAPGDALWSTAANWGGTTPVAADALFFGGSSVTNLNNDIAAATSFAGITYSAGASSFNFTNNSTTLGGDITDSTTNAQIMNLPLVLAVTRNVNVTSGGSLLLGGVISQSAASGLAKLGAGTLTLTNNNSYTGTTAVNVGTLLEDFSTLAIPSNIVSSASALTLGGGTLNLKGKSGTATVQTNASATFTANTASALVVNQNSATTVTVSLGGLTRNSGSAVDVTLPTAGAIKTTTVTTSGNNKINGSGIAYSTANGGTTWLTNSGVSPATFGALPTAGYSVDTFAASTDTDVLNNDSPSAFTNNTLRFNSVGKTLTLNSSGISQVTAGGILVTPSGTGSVITSAGGAAALQCGATTRELIIHNYGTLTLSAPITNNLAGPSVLTIGGTGTTTLSATNTHTGGTVINNGVTKLGAPTGSTGPLGATNASLVIAQLGTLDLNGYGTVKGAVTGSGIITNSSATPVTFTAGNNNTTANLNSMQIFGNVQIELNGTGWNNANGNSGLNLANTHTGGTLLSNGSAANWRFFGVGLGTGTLTFNNGSYLVPSGGPSTWDVTNAVQMLGDGLVTEDKTGGSANWPGAWTGSGKMTFTTGHTIVYNLSGDLSAFQGTISVNTANALSLTSASNTNAAQAVINLLASGTLFQYTGGANKVQLGDLNTTGNAGTATVKGTVAGTTTWQVGAKNLSSTFGGTIIDNGAALSAVTKVGTGKWTLTGANSYTGPTIVSSGVLVVNGSLSGGGAVNVFGPGALAGSGTISGLTTLASNAAITNGTGVTLSFSGGLTLNDGNMLSFGLGTVSDFIALTGGTFANNATTTPVTVNIQNLAGFAPGTYNLIMGGSIATTNNFVLGSVPSGYVGVLVSDGSSLQVTISLSALSTAWWRGSANGNWNNTGTFNWNTDQASSINAGNFPSQPTDVHFSANSAANLNTTLGADFTINTLTFDTAQNATIGGANALTVNGGITNSASAGNNVISNASVVLGLDQTWENNSANVLTVSAPVNGGRALTTIGNLVLSGNNSYGATTIASGTVQIGAGAAAGSLGSGGVTNNGNLRVNRTGSLTIGGVITGTGTFANAGGGTVVLNSVNTYNGNTAIHAGTVQLGVANAIPSGAGNGDLTVNGTLDLNTRSQILNTLTGGGVIDTFAGGTPTLILGTNDTSSSFSGVIKNTAGTLAVRKIGNGTAVLSGANTYSGNTAVNAGKLQFNGGAAMSPNSILSLNTGATLALHANADATFAPASVATFNSDPTSGADTTAFTFDVNNVTSGANQTMTLNGALSLFPTTQGNRGADQITVAVTGGNGYTLALGAITGPNNGTSGSLLMFDVASGLTLSIQSHTFAGGGNGGIQFQNSGNVTIGDIIQQNNRNLPINLNGPVVTITGNAQHTANNATATDNFNLTAGQLNINSAKALRGDNAGNTFNSILTITGGNLDNTSGNAVTMANPITQNWNADFTFLGSSSLDMSSGNVVINNNRIVTVNANTLAIGGVISDGGAVLSLTKDGAGALMLSGANTYTGGSTINNGMLGVSSAQVGAGNITVNDSTALRVTVSGVSAVSPSTLTVGSGSGATLEFVNVNSTSIAPLNPATFTINGMATVNIISLGAPLVGTYPLVSNYVSGTVMLGTLPAHLAAHLATTGNAVLLVVDAITPDVWAAGTGTWDTNSVNWKTNGTATKYVEGDAAKFDDTATGSGPFTVTVTANGVTPSSTTFTNGTKSYTIAGGAIGGAGVLNKTGNGMLILANTNTCAGGTTISAGTLQLGDAVTRNGAVAGNITANSTLVFANPADQTFAGVISGTGSVMKTNATTLTLSSANTFNGGLTVKAGKVATDNATGFGDATNVITLGDASNGADVALEVGPDWISDTQPVTVVGSGVRTLRGTHDNGGQVQFFGNLTLNNADVRFQQTGASPQRYQASAGVTGTGNIIATNLGSGGTDFRSVINNTGFVRNDSTGTGGVAEGNPGIGVPGSFGPNVTSLIQNSASSVFNLTTPNLSFLGSAQVLAGTMIASYPTALNSNNVVSVATGTTFDVQNVDLTIAGLNDISGSGGIVNDTTGASLHTLTLDGSGIYSFSGVFTAATPGNRALTVNLQSGGVQVLGGASTYNGNMTINGGTLLVNGSLDAGSAVTLNGGILGGHGSIGGPVTVNGGEFSPGASIGTLAISNSLTLEAGAIVIVEVNKTAGTSDKVIGLTNVVYGGTLYATNLSGSLNVGDNFTIFSATASSGSFSAITGSPGGGHLWSFNPASGVLSVVAGGVNTNPTNLTTTVAGNVLTLSWPADHTGWRLLVQTNHLTAGVSVNTNDWTEVLGSAGLNQTNIIMNPAKPTEFYRLVYP